MNVIKRTKPGVRTLDPAAQGCGVFGPRRNERVILVLGRSESESISGGGEGQRKRYDEDKHLYNWRWGEERNSPGRTGNLVTLYLPGQC